jgi:UDP-N-acetylglucosamine--N-acetylmuramyl-(pentapeptide) pyrophosphoryl-undecaprenol N-acetylglucosamine transferase
VKDSEAREKLVDAVLSVIRNESLQQTLKNNIAALAKPNADDDIANEVLKLINK